MGRLAAGRGTPGRVRGSRVRKPGRSRFRGEGGSRGVQETGTDQPRGGAATPPVGEPARIWATKGIGVWAFLSALLVKLQPESILELGSGRSTTFLADYAFRYRKRCVSIEQDAVWYRKVTEDLRFMNLRGTHVHHVPLDTTMSPPWYDRTTLAAAMGGGSYDLVFIDGPQGAGRRNAEGRAFLRQAAREARLLIVDDVHRPYNLAFFTTLAKRHGPDGTFFHAYGHNVIGFSAAPAWRATLRECFDFLGLAWTAEPPAAGPALRRPAAAENGAADA
jgi:hypothetical protein